MGMGIRDFKARKLTQAREARGLTQTALAKMLEVSRAAVSQYESGQRTPSRSILLRMSNVLGIPTHFFVQDDGFEVRNAVFFRSMASATKATRLRARRRYEWLVRIVSYLRDFVKLPDMCIPTFDVPADPAELSFKEIEEIANETRKEMGLGFGPISNVTWLLENKGAIVARLSLRSSRLDAFSNWCENTPFLVVNREKGSAVRCRYDVAHELAHMVLHGKVLDDAIRDRSVFKVVEDQAHYFAGAFLLPESSFGRTTPYSVTLDGLLAIKPKWKVSIAAMVKRLRHLRWISRETEQRLFIAISRRRWRTKEPLDDELEIEEPQLLRRAIELLVSEGITGVGDLEASLGIPREDIKDILGYTERYRENIIRLQSVRPKQ